MRNKRFWQFNAKKTEQASEGELLLYGDISNATWYGDEITPKQFKADMDALGDISTLRIYINSSGGDVFAGFAIYNMLMRHSAQKVVHIDGIAASIASLIAMAGDRVVMPKNAMMMIHRAWTIGIGNANDMRKLADDLDKIDESIVAVYASKTGMESDAVLEYMNQETWMGAQDALDHGFADEIEADKRIAASMTGSVLNLGGIEIDMRNYRNAPQLGFVEKEEPREAPVDLYKAKIKVNERKMNHEF